MEIRSTKSFWKLPTAHLQYQDGNGKGPCAKFHGYDRSVHFEFAGKPDEHGWLYPFGGLKQVKALLEYYLDHTAVITGNDPRLSDIIKANEKSEFLDLRILPYGVSMEMTALFLWEQINPEIVVSSQYRAYISKIEVREHDSNSAFFQTTKDTAMKQAAEVIRSGTPYMVMKPTWAFIEPKIALQKLDSLT
jgi:6-pyruvoyl-tetrahydropterin synthase